jgi:tryptophanyl-tRNA synthetase
MKAKTDSGVPGAGTEKPALFSLMKVISATDVHDQYEKHFLDGTIRYGDMKKQLAEDMVKFLSPIREKTAAIRADEKYMKDVMQQGAVKARASAKATLELVRDAIGLKYH